MKLELMHVAVCAANVVHTVKSVMLIIIEMLVLILIDKSSSGSATVMIFKGQLH